MSKGEHGIKNQFKGMNLLISPKPLKQRCLTVPGKMHLTVPGILHLTRPCKLHDIALLIADWSNLLLANSMLIAHCSLLIILQGQSHKTRSNPHPPAPNKKKLLQNHLVQLKIKTFNSKIRFMAISI